ncbi:MAG TPA: WD40 repeat domain-containing protein [Polyangia bacterium]|nr:WD40 repeat domain-containing protein [Polyangia bacterium]
MGVARGRSPGAAIVTALVWVASAGCGSRLGGQPPGKDASAKDGATMTPASGHPTGGGAPARDGAPGIVVDGGVPVGPGTTDGGGGTALAPYPPTVCPTAPPARTSPSVPPVLACGGQLALSPAVALGSLPVDHFYHCGEMGPQTATDVRLSPDGSRLALLTSAGTLRVFATDDWHEVLHIASPTGRIDAFAFSPTSQTLATLSMEPGEIQLWDTAQGTPLRAYSFTGTSGDIPAETAALAFSHDGRKLVSSLGGVVDLIFGNVVMLWSGPARQIDQLAFTFCDSMIYVRDREQTGDSNESTDVTLYDASTGKRQSYLFGNWSEYFGGSALSQDGRLIAVSNGYYPNGSASAAYDLSIYRGDTGELVDHRPVWTAGFIQAFTPDDSALMVTTTANTLDQWRIADGTVVTSFFFSPGSRLLGFSRPDAVTFSDQSETTTYSLSGGGSRILYSLRFRATAASWSASGIGAAVGPDGALFHLWRDADGSSLCAPAPPTSTAPATSFALSGDGRVLGIGKADGVIDLFDAQTSAQRASVETVQGPIGALALSGDGQVAASRIDGTSPVLVWGRDGTRIAAVPSPPPDPSTFVPRVAFALSPDARTIALPQGEATVLADVASASTQTLSLLPQWAWVAGAPFSPDGAHLAGRLSGVLSTWRVLDGVRDDFLPAPPPTSAFNTGAMALTSDWSLAAATNEKDFVLWDLLGAAAPLVVPGVPYQYSSILAVGTATVAVNEYLSHTFGGDFYVAHLHDTRTGTQLRQFAGYPGARPLLLSPDGQRAYTLEGPDVIAWCR